MFVDNWWHAAKFWARSSANLAFKYSSSCWRKSSVTSFSPSKSFESSVFNISAWYSIHCSRSLSFTGSWSSWATDSSNAAFSLSYEAWALERQMLVQELAIDGTVPSFIAVMYCCTMSIHIAPSMRWLLICLSFMPHKIFVLSSATCSTNSGLRSWTPMESKLYKLLSSTIGRTMV